MPSSQEAKDTTGFTVCLHLCLMIRFDSCFDLLIGLLLFLDLLNEIEELGMLMSVSFAGEGRILLLENRENVLLDVMGSILVVLKWTRVSSLSGQRFPV